MEQNRMSLPVLQLKDIRIPNFIKDRDREIQHGFIELMKELGFKYLEENGIWGYSYEKLTVEPGDVCIDCGSNLGLVAAWMATKGASKVYAFEPAKNIYPRLQQTASLYPDIISPYNIALGATQSSLVFVETISTIGSHFSKYDVNPFAGFSTSYQVDVESIDALFLNENVNFIKMDCEGAERDILVGAQEVIRRCRPKMVISHEYLQDDQIVLPQLIKAIVPEYNIVANHSNFYCWVEKK